MYVVLTGANPNDEPKASTKNDSKPQSIQKKKTATSTPSVKTAVKQSVAKSEETNSNQRGPDININLQIHISSDATPDQIDKIFESMSKHIYKSG